MDRRRAIVALIVAAAAAASASAGCRARTRDAAARREVTVLAAASLREAFDALARDFRAAHPDADVRIEYAGSQQLRVQIEQGARADVFASADDRQIMPLARQRLAAAPRVFARNVPVVVVPAANPAHLASFADLPRAARVVIGAPTVPIGAYTLQILERARASLGSEFQARVLAHVVSRELNVRQVLAKVVLGEADAGIVYRTDARVAAGKVTVLPIPDAIDVDAAYLVATLAAAPAPDLARAFVDVVVGADGQARLAAAGFAPAESPTAAR